MRAGLVESIYTLAPRSACTYVGLTLSLSCTLTHSCASVWLGIMIPDALRTSFSRRGSDARSPDPSRGVSPFVSLLPFLSKRHELRLLSFDFHIECLLVDQIHIHDLLPGTPSPSCRWPAPPQPSILCCFSPLSTARFKKLSKHGRGFTVNEQRADRIENSQTASNA